MLNESLQVILPRNCWKEFHMKICNCFYFKMPGQQPSRVPYFSLALIFVLLLQLLAPPVCAKSYRVPVKRRFSSDVIHINLGNTESSQAHTYQAVRGERSTTADFSHMKNNLNGLSGDGYYIDVDIGIPPQRMQVLIDTGSANFAVAAESDPNISHFFHRENSTTFTDAGIEIYVPYTEGEWTGVLGTDVVSVPFADNVSATANIACITESKAFFNQDSDWQGILGLAYKELSRPDSSYLPFWDSLQSDDPDIPDVFSVQLCGSSFIHTREKPLMEGSLIIGGVQPSMSKGPMLYSPIYKQWYYEIVLTDIHIGGTSLGLDCKEYNFDKTIVDTGTTNIRLPVKVFDAVVSTIDKHLQMGGYMTDFPGPSFYNGDDITCFMDMAGPFSAFPVVSFYLYHSENSTFRLDVTPQHYLRPVMSEMGEGITLDQSCVKFGFSPSTSGTVLGAVLMEGFYVIFDREESRIGFGQTTCPLPDPEHPILEPTIAGPFPSNRSQSECAYKKPDDDTRTFLVVSYIMAAMSVVLILPLVMLFFMWTRRAIKRRQGYHTQEESSETQNVLSDS